MGGAHALRWSRPSTRRAGTQRCVASSAGGGCVGGVRASLHRASRGWRSRKSVRRAAAPRPHPTLASIHNRHHHRHRNRCNHRLSPRRSLRSRQRHRCLPLILMTREPAPRLLPAAAASHSPESPRSPPRHQRQHLRLPCQPRCLLLLKLVAMHAWGRRRLRRRPNRRSSRPTSLGGGSPCPGQDHVHRHDRRHEWRLRRRRRRASSDVGVWPLGLPCS